MNAPIKRNQLSSVASWVVKSILLTVQPRKRRISGVRTKWLKGSYRVWFPKFCVFMVRNKRRRLEASFDMTY